MLFSKELEKHIKHIMKDVLDLIKKKDPDYRIVRDRSNRNDFLLQKKRDYIGHVLISYNEEDSAGICEIPFISIEKGYRTKGLGKLLLIYGMLQAKLDYPDINEYRLDDDSDNNNYMGKNIYNQLGFLGDVRRLETNTKSSSYAPDKSAHFPNFLLRALRQTKLAKKYEDLYDEVAKNQVISRTLRTRPPRESGGKTRRNRP